LQRPVVKQQLVETAQRAAQGGTFSK
jgi:hypothetical protein